VPALFVHGVPDTERVWRAVLSRLGRRDAVTLSLPGFGCQAPTDFAATKDAYAAWLVEQITAHGGAVDLVGHDWGAILVLRAACLRPDLVRSWAAGAGPLDAEYVWHKTAQLWQTPEVGEHVMTKFTAAALEKGLSAEGVPPADARETAAHVDDTMKRCILRLYRSAITVGAEWGPDLDRLTHRASSCGASGIPTPRPRGASAWPGEPRHASSRSRSAGTGGRSSARPRWRNSS
jgi:pimeloyl-ACP methyl ester carboxylesterase